MVRDLEVDGATLDWFERFCGKLMILNYIFKKNTTPVFLL